MTTFNGHTVIQRGNRPSPISPAKLDFLFVKDGSYVDPFQVCSVHIFPNTAFDTATPYIDTTAGSTTYGLVNSTANNMVFHNQGVDPLSVPPFQVTGFDAAATETNMAKESSYIASDPMTASGIFRTGPGRFSVLLQTNTKYWSTSATSFTAPPYFNSASGTGGYIDIWTLVDTAGSKAQIYVSMFNLTTANVFGSTQALAVTTNNKLVQRYVNMGSKKKLQIKTELVVDNSPMMASLRNLMETGALVQHPQISITKLNESPGMTSRVQITGNGTVGGFNDGTNVELDSNGTISYLWDTDTITAFYPDEQNGMGGPVGVYEVQVRFQLLEETILSPRFKLIVR